uniref:Pterin-4 alpha-carbinolamine dehydratase 2 n=1 Tax=Rousettus aegyptiacus TaxID=9407 RepID=A0A7J8FL02_ROUAE|nr:pterin-4 alpha-carbinolamine dehydratase 2 [Rousettus aegyptiacus]
MPSTKNSLSKILIRKCRPYLYAGRQVTPWEESYHEAKAERGVTIQGIWLYVPSCPTSREDESSPGMVQRVQQGPDNSYLS